MIKILLGSLLVSAMFLATQSQATGIRNERYVPVNDQQMKVYLIAGTVHWRLATH